MLLIQTTEYDEQDQVLTPDDWKRASLVAGAVNLTAVAHGFKDMARAVYYEGQARGKSSAWVAKHPIILVFADKIAALTGTQNVGHPDILDAYQMVREKINEKVLRG